MWWGIVLGLLYVLSPLTVWSTAAFAGVVWLAIQGLAEAERRTVIAVLTTAFAVRLLIILVLFIAGIPHHNDLAVGALSGDEAYNLSRALRTRDVVLGTAPGKYDFVVAFDEYGRSSYLSFLAALQVIFGPTPYGVRVFNAVLFLAGAAVLFRLARAAFGWVPAIAALTVLVFLPSLIYASTSVLKESSYFAAGALLLGTVVALLRSRHVAKMALALIVAVAMLWLLNDLRRGANILIPAGLAVGLALRVAMTSTRRAIFSIAVAVIVAAGALSQPPVVERLLAGLTSAAKIHTGHVFTVGHPYKLLDAAFYVNPQTPTSSTITLTAGQAARFVGRGVMSFVATPLPWQIESKRELAIVPAVMLWYVLVLGVPLGIVAGWRRDSLVTALLIGFVLPTAAVLALTNGNVGTLVRLRDLVVPYVIWLSVLGYCAAIERIHGGRVHAAR